MNIFIPENVQFIIDEFYKNGFEAFMVGGCIRDALLFKTPKDYDIATSALPNDTISLFNKTIPTGLKHGTVTVLIGSEPFEVTTYRKDGDYKDNRRPDSVQFVTDIRDDLSRRDFTINAFAYNKKIGLIDYFNGKEDLNKKLIRSCGDPDKRFKEDALRMLRAIRFSSQLDFSIEDETLKSIEKNKELLKNISAERIRDELTKILISKNPKKGLNLLKELNLLEYVLPEIVPTVGFNQHNPYHNEDVFSHILSVIENTPSDLIVRLSALFHDIGKPDSFFLDENNKGRFYGHNTVGEKITKKALRRLKFDNKTIDRVSKLVREHMNVLDPPTKGAIKRLIGRVSLDDISNLLYLQEADIKSLAINKEPLAKFYIMKEKAIEIINLKEPISIKDLDIDGSALIKELNIKPSKIIGEILNHLLSLVIDDPNLNSYPILLENANKYIKTLGN